jgi:hypothetical protein
MSAPQGQDQENQQLSNMIEGIILSSMENVNPAPTNALGVQDLTELLELAQRYATLIEPSQMFTRRIFAFLDTIQNQRFLAQARQQQQRTPRVQVTRVGAKRVFGADITHELDQNRNIAANFQL